MSINGFPPAVVEATTHRDQWPAEPFTGTGLQLLAGTKDFLRQQRFLKRDFTVEEWIAPGAR